MGARGKNGFRRCRKCGVEKPLSEFYWRNNPKTKRSHPYANCRLCIRIAASREYHKRRLIDALL